MLDDLAGDHKLAGHTRARNRRRIERRKKADRQPHLEIQAAIDELILEGDQLKLLAEEYFLDPVGAEVRFQAEEEQRRLEEENKEQRLLKKQRQLQLLGVAIVLFIVAFLCGRLADFSEAARLLPLASFFGLLSLITFLLSTGFFVFFWSTTRG